MLVSSEKVSPLARSQVPRASLWTGVALLMLLRVSASSACMCVCVCAQSLQSYLTLCNPMDCSLIHGILQARILEWVVMPSSERPFQPRIKPVCPVSLVLQADSLPLSHWESPVPMDFL